MANYNKSNVYLDASGNVIKGRYVYPRPGGKYQAMVKYPEGYNKSKICYDLEEAVAFVKGEWDTYASGSYVNEYGETVRLRRKDEPKTPREY